MLVAEKIVDIEPNYCEVYCVMFKRRLGPDPHEAGGKTFAIKGCPDLFELENGDFAIIGTDITQSGIPNLPTDASCGPDERIVQIPRRTLVNAKADIPGSG